MVVVLASGNGSNFEAIVKAGLKDVVLICDNKDAYVLKRADNLGVTSIVITAKNKVAFNEKLLQELKKLQPQLIILAGFMRIISSEVIKVYPRIINLHPSLLPAFKGKNAIEDAYNYNVKVTGITIHFIDDKIDEGEIVFQKALEIEGLSLEELTEKIHILEHRYYPLVIKKILKEMNYESFS